MTIIWLWLALQAPLGIFVGKFINRGRGPCTDRHDNFLK